VSRFAPSRGAVLPAADGGARRTENALPLLPWRNVGRYKLRTMREAPPTPPHPHRQRALAIALIASLALAAWGIASPRRSPSGVKNTPVQAPLKPQLRERPTLSLDPESVCQAPSLTRPTKAAKS
jgi:hypothetical protein